MAIHKVALWVDTDEDITTIAMRVAREVGIDNASIVALEFIADGYEGE